MMDAVGRQLEVKMRAFLSNQMFHVIDFTSPRKKLWLFSHFFFNPPKGPRTTKGYSGPLETAQSNSRYVKPQDNEEADDLKTQYLCGTSHKWKISANYIFVTLSSLESGSYYPSPAS